jgi:hypothetical protein
LWRGANLYASCCSACTGLAKFISAPLQVFTVGNNLIHQANFCETLKKVLLNFKDDVPLNLKINHGSVLKEGLSIDITFNPP